MDITTFVTKEPIVGNCNNPYLQSKSIPKPKKDVDVIYAFPTEKEHNPYSAANDQEEVEEEQEEEEEEEYNPYAAVGGGDEESEGVLGSEGDIPEEESEESPNSSESSTEENSETEDIELSPSGERDWDGEFQIISAMDNNDIRKHVKLARLADDFQNGLFH